MTWPAAYLETDDLATGPPRVDGSAAKASGSARIDAQDLKLEIYQLTRKEAVNSARYLAEVVGKAHARRMDAATRKLLVRHSKVVDLRNEMRHCGFDRASWNWLLAMRQLIGALLTLRAGLKFQNAKVPKDLLLQH